MVAPVTGPYQRDRQTIPPVWPGTNYPNPGYADLNWRRIWYRQKRPYDRPLSFEFRMNQVNRYNQLPQWQATNSDVFYYDFTTSFLASERSWAKNQALARFNGKVKESASWLVSLVEARQSMTMMAQRLEQLGYVTKQLLRGRVDLAAKSLGIFGTEDYRAKRRMGKVKANAKAAADNFLELSLGWIPLVKDIYATADALQRPFPAEPVKAFSRIYFRKTGGDPSYSYFPTGYTQCTIGAEVSVSNPNLWLANQLGLINPAVVSFEVIPWSFVLGWFVNVQEYLSQFTEYAGLSVQNPYYTEGSFCTCQWYWKVAPHLGVGSQSRRYVVRTVGALPSVDLVVKKPWRLSPMRAGIAASLVVQNLSTMQPSRARDPSWRVIHS